MAHFEIPCKKYCFSNVLLPACSLSGATKGRVTSNSRLKMCVCGILDDTNATQHLAPCSAARIVWGLGLRQNYKAS